MNNNLIFNRFEVADVKKMGEPTHDPSEYIRQLQDLLTSDKKKIAFLFGAGTSLPHIRTITKLTQNIEEKLVESNDKYKDAIDEIKDQIGSEKYNIETLLSNLEQKKQIIGNDSLNGLTADDISNMIKTIKELIRKYVSIHERIEKNPDDLENLDHCRFAEWIGRADRKFAVEIFTTNYDYLIEIGLESKNISYYDGFTGSYKPFFDSESVEDLNFLRYTTKLWKIHGSLGWQFNKEYNKVLREEPKEEEDLLIYPSTLKYYDSKKQPYISYLDRLSNFLKQDDAILITNGYSFRDEHINERIMTALKSNNSAHVFALYYDIIENKNGKKEYCLKNSPLVKMAKRNSKLSVYGFRNAVIGCQYREWKLKIEPDELDTINVNFYFDEDAHCTDEKTGVEQKGSEIWTGNGEFILPDFPKLVKFLNSWVVDKKLTSDVK